MSYGSQGPNKDTRSLSDALWAGFIKEKLFSVHDRTYGVGMFDDFTSFSGLVSSNVGRYHSEGNHYLSYETNSTSIVNVALTPTPATVAPTSIGAIALTPTTTDGDTVALQYGGTLVSPYGCFPFAVIPGISGDLAFEARFKVSTIAAIASSGSFFCGLAGAAGVAPIATAVPITSSDAFVTTLSLLGFAKTTTSLTGATAGDVGLVYERAGGTLAAKATIATLVADTYVKLGFRYNSLTNQVTSYVNGVPVNTSSKLLSPTLSGVTPATPWPNDYMTPVVAVEEAGTAAQTLTMDWWACGQLFKSLV